MSTYKSPVSAPPRGSMSPQQTEHMAFIAAHPGHDGIAEQSKLAEWAAKGMPEELHRAMSEHPEVDPRIALAWAAENQREDCLALCLSRYEPGVHHAMAVELALDHGNPRIIAMLLASASLPELADALRKACLLERPEAARAILSSTSVRLALEPQSTDPEGLGTLTPYECAASCGSPLAMKALAESIGLPADDFERDALARALFLSAQSGSRDCAAIAASLCPDPEAAAQAFREACALDHAACAELLFALLPPGFDSTDILWACAESLAANAIPIAARMARLDLIDDEGHTLAEAILWRELAEPFAGEHGEPDDALEALLLAGVPLPKGPSPSVSMAEHCRDQGRPELARALQETASRRESMELARIIPEQAPRKPGATLRA